MDGCSWSLVCLCMTSEFVSGASGWDERVTWQTYELKRVCKPLVSRESNTQAGLHNLSQEWRTINIIGARISSHCSHINAKIFRKQITSRQPEVDCWRGTKIRSDDCLRDERHQFKEAAMAIWSFSVAFCEDDIYIPVVFLSSFLQVKRSLQPAHCFTAWTSNIQGGRSVSP